MITSPSYFIPKRRGLTPAAALAGASRWRALIVSFLLVATLGAGLVTGANPAFSAEVQETPATVNINTADAATLAAVLKGVGESRAVEIVRHRQTYGAFSTVDELMEVKGIGRATLDLNREAITLE